MSLFKDEDVREDALDLEFGDEPCGVCGEFGDAEPYTIRSTSGARSTVWRCYAHQPQGVPVR